jgi:trigger factor
VKTIVKKVGECKRLLEIELPETIVQEKFIQVYSELRKEAELRGFRKGKAPQDLLRKYYGKTATAEVTQRLILESFKRAVKEENLAPISSPQIRDIKLESTNTFSFKAEIEIKPQFKLKNYKNLKVKKKKIEVNDKDVEEVLLRLQEMNAQLHPVTGRTATKKGDWLLCDCKLFKGGNCVEEKENVWVALEEGKTSKEFIDGLVGANIGSTVTIKEKDVIHSIKVKEIKEKCLPTLDDNFAHSINRCKNLAELKELIYNDLVRHNEAKVKLDMKNQLLQQLLKDNKFSCPPSLVEEELEQLVNEAKLRQNLQRREEKKVFSQEEAMKEELKTEAENRVRLSFILDEIARQ